MTHAPWTDEEVENLNKYQAAGVFHPFTCPHHSQQDVLVATHEGWVCSHCDYKQDWAHDFMLDKTARTPWWEQIDN
jgi:ABC-type lipoprotein export system ATPase subunit